MRKKRLISVFLTLILLITVLASCGSNPSGVNDDSLDAIDPPPANIETDQGQVSEPAEYTDEEGFITVRLEDGEAEVRYNVDVWEDAWGYMRDFVDPENMKQLEEGSFPVNGLPSKVVDAFVGQITALGDHYLLPFSPPMIVFLLEDGTVAYIEADVFSPFYEEGITATILQGLTDIVSISYESSGEGIGDSTVYATDNKGMRYDTLIAWNLRFLMRDQWLCILEMDESGMPAINGYLQFFPGNKVRWFVGWPDSDIAMDYEGTYELNLAEGQENRPGTIRLDMEQVYIIDGEPSDVPFEGTYFIESTFYGELRLSLYPLDGDTLYTPDFDVYEFFLANAYDGIYDTEEAFG